MVHLRYCKLFYSLLHKHHFPSIFITSQPNIRSLPAAHHEEVCDYYEQRRELPLPVYHKSANKSALYTPFSSILLKLSFTAATSS